MRIHDQASDLVLLIGNYRLGEELGQGQIGERHLRRHSLGGAGRRDSRQIIPAPRRRSPGQQGSQVVEGIA